MVHWPPLCPGPLLRPMEREGGRGRGGRGEVMPLQGNIPGIIYNSLMGLKSRLPKMATFYLSTILSLQWDLSWAQWDLKTNLGSGSLPLLKGCKKRWMAANPAWVAYWWLNFLSYVFSVFSKILTAIHIISIIRKMIAVIKWDILSSMTGYLSELVWEWNCLSNFLMVTEPWCQAQDSVSHCSPPWLCAIWWVAPMAMGQRWKGCGRYLYVSQTYLL